MIKGYMSIKEVSEKWGITPRRIQILCFEGRIEGAAKLGREWAIPTNADRPIDGRVTTGAYRNWRNSKR
ncbi:MAG: helix-turn-helix domain-containing protein [Lachnospiraceae bacterium]|nr:helix-turn-helix domain-containing protein [Lachnospiraceae bacterium]